MPVHSTQALSLPRVATTLPDEPWRSPALALVRVRAHDSNVPERARGRVVYSTGIGRVCPTCGWPADRCVCSRLSSRAAAVPAKITARLRLEKKGRGGKSVTVVGGLPDNQAFLKELCHELKRTCGTGGTAGEGEIELQGDLRDRVRHVLAAKGFVVKG